MKSAKPPILERILDPVSRCFTPEVAASIVQIKIDSSTQELLDEWAAKSTSGTLSPQERKQYETYVMALDLLAILQSKARRSLKKT